MCNVYRPPAAERVHIVFGVSPPSPYKSTLGPMDRGPFVTSKGALVGQWGMIPPRSATHIPMTKEGRRLSTNNARIETVATAWTFRDAWRNGRRCLIPADSFDEPNWESRRNEWWTFKRADGMPWALAGLFGEWTDPETGEVLSHYTMLTQNCDAHPLLSRMHKSNPNRPPDQQDKRTVVPIDQTDWSNWLTGDESDALELVIVPKEAVFDAGPRT